MCGIAGIYNSNQLNIPNDIIKKMSDAIIHRGPDQDGYYLDPICHLASRRLSIIDLPLGKQPIYSNCKTKCIVYNGEIYNFKEIKNELLSLGFIFYTNSDTEVVLNAYCAWQEACLDKFKGMFAFAIYDNKKKELFIARDRLGIKPLYYHLTNDKTFIFASEIKAILQYPNIQKNMHTNAINNILTYGFNLAPNTFFKDIKELLPGHFIKINNNNIEFKQYWDININANKMYTNENDAAEALKESFIHQIKQHLISDVPVAAYLSGGIDSSATASVYNNLSSCPIKTFTISFDDNSYDETNFSRKMADHLNTDNIEFKCNINTDDIKKMIWHLENPLVTLLHLPLFLLSKQVMQAGFKVVLSGDGSDEIFGGYQYFKLLKSMQFINKQETPFRKNILRKIYPQMSSPVNAEMHYQYLKTISNAYPVNHPAIPYQFQEFQLKRQLYSKKHIEQLTSIEADNPFWFDIDKIKNQSLIQQALYIETKMRLLKLTLPLSDKMSMANSIELRPPFLDHDFVDLVFSIPDKFKLKALEEKSIFKKSMQNILPDYICKRRKQPLLAPSDWFIKNSMEMIKYYLSDSVIKEKGYFNPNFINKIFTEYNEKTARSDYSGIIITVFFIQLWDELFL